MGCPRKELILGIICSSPPGEVFICIVAYILSFSLNIGWLSLGGRCGEDREVELEERRKKIKKLGTFFFSLQVSANNELYVLASLSQRKLSLKRKTP